MIRYARWLMMWALLLATSLAQAGTKHYYYADPQGTPLAKADAQGNVVARYEYTPYGVPVTSVGAAPDGVGYTGHVNDPETGLVYMQARYYDADVGRFLSVDPVSSFAAGKYTYANSNPHRFIDPDGRASDDTNESCNIECKRARQQERERKHSEPYGAVWIGSVPADASSSPSPGGSSNSGQQLSYKEWAPPSHGSNGAITYSIIWKLDKVSVLGGYIIQKLVITGTGSSPGFPVNLTSWEAWKVPAGSNQTELVVSQNYQFDDTFSFGGSSSGHGSLTWNASARFYEGLMLPSSFVVGGSRTSGQLLSTMQDPHLPTGAATGPVDRTLNTTW